VLKRPLGARQPVDARTSRLTHAAASSTATPRRVVVPLQSAVAAGTHADVVLVYAGSACHTASSLSNPGPGDEATCRANRLLGVEGVHASMDATTGPREAGGRTRRPQAHRGAACMRAPSGALRPVCGRTSTRRSGTVPWLVRAPDGTHEACAADNISARGPCSRSGGCLWVVCGCWVLRWMHRRYGRLAVYHRAAGGVPPTRYVAGRRADVSACRRRSFVGSMGPGVQWRHASLVRVRGTEAEAAAVTRVRNWKGRKRDA